MVDCTVQSSIGSERGKVPGVLSRLCELNKASQEACYLCRPFRKISCLSHPPAQAILPTFYKKKPVPLAMSSVFSPSRSGSFTVVESHWLLNCGRVFTEGLGRPVKFHPENSGLRRKWVHKTDNSHT